MKKKQITLIISTIITICALESIGYTQFNSAGTPLNDRWGQTDDPPLINNDIRRVGIGHFVNFGTAPSASFHINSNYLTDVDPLGINTFLDGEVFRTTATDANINAWRMFTGAGSGTEKFVLYAPALSSDIFLQSTLGNLLFNTALTSRIFIGGPSYANPGFVGIGDNFVAPKFQLHVNGSLAAKSIFLIRDDETAEDLSIVIHDLKNEIENLKTELLELKNQVEKSKHSKKL